MLPEFKLIVAGGREFNDYNLLHNTLMAIATAGGIYEHREVSIVSGMARGADALGAKFARENNVKLYEVRAEWRPDGIYNPRGGFERNADMGHFADGLLAFWDGQSRGTAHMIEYMKKLGKPVHIVGY